MSAKQNTAKQDILDAINTKHDADYINQQLAECFYDFVDEHEAFKTLTDKEQIEVKHAWLSDLMDRLDILDPAEKDLFLKTVLKYY